MTASTNNFSFQTPRILLFAFRGRIGGEDEKVRDCNGRRVGVGIGIFRFLTVDLAY
uniref:Uncharacterized protein n=1 Tax=Rhizophora mucronata TaxID=61149 RepID=A0A2P2J251_RHIMU